MYRVTAENQAGADSASFDVKVKSKFSTLQCRHGVNGTPGEDLFHADAYARKRSFSCYFSST